MKLAFNFYAVRAIYAFEMARTRRTLLQSIVSPVISTSLYFVVFGSAIGSRITQIQGVNYGAFIVPGLIMLTLLTQSTMNASFGIYFPRFVGTIYELLSAPVSALEIVLGYVGAAAIKSIILGVIILATAWLFVPIRIVHPFWMVAISGVDGVDLQPVRLHSSGSGPIASRSCRSVPLLIITPLTFLGGTFYAIQRAAAAVADRRAVQSAGLSDLRLPLELLRHRRRECRLQSRDDALVPGDLHGGGLVVLQDRLPAEELISYVWALHSAPHSSSPQRNCWRARLRGAP